MQRLNRPPGSAHTAVVLLHGFSSTTDVWGYFLPLLESDPDLTRFVFLPFPYETKYVSLNPRRRVPSISDAAASLATYVEVDLSGYDSLALVTHSQGGLVAQRFVANFLHEGKAKRLRRLDRIVMFGCPNDGSELAISVRRSMVFWRNPQERELRPLNETITATRRTVIARAVNAKSFSDTECPMRILAIAGESDRVVRPESAKSVFPDTAEVPGDHSTIVQSDSRLHRSYTLVRSELLEVAARYDYRDSQGQPTIAQRADESAQTSTGSGIESTKDNVQARRELIDTLLEIQELVDPASRQEIYSLLPPRVAQSIPRSATPRIEMVSMARTFDRYVQLRPWSALIEALRTLDTPGQEIDALAEMVDKYGLV